MEQNYSSTKLPTVAATNNTGHTAPPVVWANPSRITADDASSATWNASLPGQGANIVGSVFGFQQLPPEAVIDGIGVFIDGSNIGCFGDITLNISGSTGKAIGSLAGSYGGPTDLWGKTSISVAEIAALTVSVDTEDVSGGDGIATMDYMSVTVYWHIEMQNVPDADVPTRIDYKVYSSDGRFLGLLPKVTSKFGFAQDINSAGSSIQITCGKFIKNEVTASPLLTEGGDIITTENDLPILATSTELLVTTGNSPDDAIFKNGNRVKVWMTNRYYPNGKLMFSGQVNRVNFKYGGPDAVVQLTVYSDGLDLNNYITRGYPFSYTTDQSQVLSGSSEVITADGGKGSGWNMWGQSWRSGGAVTNLGAITIRLNGTADVTIYVYDAPNGNFLGSVTQSISTVGWENPRFDLSALIDINSSDDYFFGVGVAPGQSIMIASSASDVYANGTMYNSNYGGGSGGGLWYPATGDLHFITYSGLPTTTTTYTSDDPVSEMAHGILLDYNARGGYITERDFEATGLSLTYTFVVATILDALKKILELCPSGYYMNMDLGTAELDIKQISDTADFTVVRGRHIQELSLGLTIEQVKNYLLLSGGEVTPGVNLYRDYTDAESAGNYGIRTATKSDNRITLAATANAIGDSFIEENANEQQETTLVVKDEKVDITQFVPGKTIGFKNFGNFIDDMVLQIVRREPNFSDGVATLTLGRLPVRMNDEIQRIQRELLNEQTIANPTAPS